ncbi:MAG TPA: hypothetical protein ENN74_03485 [Firmicutes bacterium]|nr:hypothetical protein [Bacillota bacterium]
MTRGRSRMINVILAAVFVVVAGAIVAWRVREGRKGEADAGYQLAPPEIIAAGEAARFIDGEAAAIRLRTTRDVLPGGYSAAMTPLLVDWNRSDFSPGGEVLLIGVNHGGNPLSGVTELRSAAVRPDLVAEVQFIMVPLGGPRAIAHGMLRFIFESDGARLRGERGEIAGQAETLDDLLLSWEAWRAPGVDYRMLKGMDPRTYELACRGYSGPQRFLEDALMNRDWEVYRLRLPGGCKGYAELLRVGLAVGDGAARHSLAWMIEQVARQDQKVARRDEQSARKAKRAGAEGAAALEAWRSLRERAVASSAPDDDPRVDMRGQTGYHSLLRSCANMSLYTIDVAVARLIEAGFPAEGMVTTQEPELREAEGWMVELAEADLADILLRAPRMLAYALEHPTIIPGKIPGALEKAGLLELENGRPWKVRYSVLSETPWGHRWHLLTR